jgi:hypothetical protein
MSVGHERDHGKEGNRAGRVGVRLDSPIGYIQLLRYSRQYARVCGGESNFTTSHVLEWACFHASANA